MSQADGAGRAPWRDCSKCNYSSFAGRPQTTDSVFPCPQCPGHAKSLPRFCRYQFRKVLLGGAQATGETAKLVNKSTTCISSSGLRTRGSEVRTSRLTHWQSESGRLSAAKAPRRGECAQQARANQSFRTRQIPKLFQALTAVLDAAFCFNKTIAGMMWGFPPHTRMYLASAPKCSL